MEKKKITRKQSVIFLLIVFVAAIVISAIIFSGNPTSPANTTPSSTAATITKAEFDKIENGMTYDQVNEIIGGDGELQAESGEKGSDIYTVSYKWDGESLTGSAANLTFQGATPKLQSKVQVGLK
ncbi:hypothetical protein ACRQV7_03010 [Caproiciproducens sp. R2]|uniref:hypothetical protein n=1 Tax=Caproiciproducens sp. R2 TaxID=3435187 RepID=UPI0040349510